MAKNYKEYCRDAIRRDPKIYGIIFNEDGSKKKDPSMTSFYKKKEPKNVPHSYLSKLEKNGWKPCLDEEKEGPPPELEITGTEIKLNGRIQNLTIKKLPNKSDKKEYNRIWMHNDRVRKKLKILKEKYGVTRKI